MKTNELYLKILRKIRYGNLSKVKLYISDYEMGSKELAFIAQYNEAMKLLSDLIDIMEIEEEEVEE